MEGSGVAVQVAKNESAAAAAKGKGGDVTAKAEGVAGKGAKMRRSSTSPGLSCARVIWSSYMPIFPLSMR